MADSDWNKLTVAQLKEECLQRGLPTVPGKKIELVGRILEHIKVTDSEQLLEGEDTGDNDAADPVDDAILDSEVQGEEGGQGDGVEVGEGESGEPEEEAEVDGGEDEVEGGEEAMEGDDGGNGEDDTNEEEDNGAEGISDGKKSDVSKDAKSASAAVKTDGKKIKLPEGVPDLPTYNAIQEARIAETRMRTVIVYPMNIEDMSNEKLHEMLTKSQHFMVKFVQNSEKQKKGFVEMHFNTRKDAREAASVLREIKLASGDHTVRQLEPDEAGTAYKSAVIDSIKPHLTHQIKKATDDYDTRVVYVHNLPEDASDETMDEAFPEAKAVLTAIGDDDKNKGYAYLSFETEEESEDCIKKHTELKIHDNRITLHMIKDLKAAAGIEARKPFRRGGGARIGRGGNMQTGHNARGGPQQNYQQNNNNRRMGPDNRRGGPGQGQGRGGYNNMNRGGYRGGRGGGGGQVGTAGVPSLMSMPARLGGFMGGQRPYVGQRDMPQYDMGYMQFQDRKRRAPDAGFLAPHQPWKMQRMGGGNRGYNGGGGNWGNNRW